MNYRQQVIVDNITARENEITVYDINIANYKHVLDNVSVTDTVTLKDFLTGLHERIAAERLERRKAELILNALRSQLES